MVKASGTGVQYHYRSSVPVPESEKCFQNVVQDFYQRKNASKDNLNFFKVFRLRGRHCPGCFELYRVEKKQHLVRKMTPRWLKNEKKIHIFCFIAFHSNTLKRRHLFTDLRGNQQTVVLIK